MQTTGSPTVRRRRLASELRRMREQADLTLDQVAARLGWSISKVSRIETCKVGVTPQDVGRIVGLYEVSPMQFDEVMELARDAQKKGWWQAFGDLPADYATYIGLEAEASAIRSFAADIVPGLLQVEDYARSVIRNTLVISPPGEVERRIKVRMTRRELLSRTVPLKLWVILDEAALRRVVGNPAVMNAQLKHILAAAEAPNVTIQVLPFTAGAHSATSGAFSIMEFPDQADTDVVYLDNLTGSLYVEKEVDVYRYTLAFDHLRAKALDPDESGRLIAELAHSYGDL
ncbi:helix-turn-helix domain-containing protein [Sphaerisporangium rubeum]|uniref:Transcriptional regulator with XRE-family HTH domain n=1 Tax=Sphaerisporangium rubeum TaxID=321317 RepID=A0A7X0M5C1_9ACTN|nr:helix-turn-helix transcriptional regulator [Sphaerisporangium rubeum]MBB6472235.1 transcriptional regulator with XRE-family HTH domain [Sphaerisporangium rubeum]